MESGDGRRGLINETDPERREAGANDLVIFTQEFDRSLHVVRMNTARREEVEEGSRSVDGIIHQPSSRLHERFSRLRS